ncbi:MAG: hypothetical protein KGO05_13310 [Chloroflexota bacterium]|nr:hypothetical protein [Chloroflexota bacterium]
MTGFRRLPHILRVASLLRPLFPLGLFAGIAYLVTAGAWSHGPEAAYASRVAVFAMNLSVLGLGCAVIVHVYNSRFREPDRQPFPLESWQSQARAILALAATPVCALVLAIVIPPTARAFEFVFPVSLIGVIVCVAVTLLISAR